MTEEEGMFMHWFGLSLGKQQVQRGRWHSLFQGKRNRILFVATFACLLFTFNFSVVAATARHYPELEFPPLPEIKIPQYTRYVMNNGLVVYLMENHELPLVSGTALFHTGDRLEPAAKIGLAELTGSVMRTGGTKHHSPDELNQLLEQRAAFVESGIGTAEGSANFNTLTENLETVFDLFAEVIQEPVFAQSQLDLAKTRLRGEIARRNDSPNSIASREFSKLVYGSTSPYARTVEYATLGNIQREDLVSFYQKYFHPNNLILGVVGDFETQAMRALIQQKFGDWQPDPQLEKSEPPSVQPFKPGDIFFVNQPQLTQSSVLLGHLGGKRNDPDFAALSVMNGVLSGFGGRLFNQVRSRQGLAYSVYGAWNPQFDYPGMFIAGGQTRSQTTVPFIQAILNEIKRIRTEPVTPAELAYAKDSTLNSFIFNFQDPEQTLSRLIHYEYYNYPSDFIFRFHQGVEATRIEDVQRVAQKYLQPDQIVTLVVGNSATIQPPLTNLSAHVTSIDITIPGAKNS